jgi:hypothetical protein
MNPFRDPRNIDNIVAKRGALFMVDLVEARAGAGVHGRSTSRRTRSRSRTPLRRSSSSCRSSGPKYGYTFEHEATYKKMCLVNDAVLIAYVGWNQKGKPEHWKAVGKEFQHPYVYKMLFTDDPISFRDLCETKQMPCTS